MGVIHALLSGKGGSGKSYFGATLAQYLVARGRPTTCFDIDPVNATLSAFRPDLDVQEVEVRRDDDIDRRAFDALVDSMCEAAGTGTVILDSGASTFVPLTKYLDKYQVADTIRDKGHTVVFHGVVIGGQAMDYAMRSLMILLSNPGFAASPVVVWVNPFFGPVERSGARFEQLNVYTAYRNRYAGIVHVPEVDELQALDVRSMLAENETFARAVGNEQRITMVRQRLSLIRDELFSAIDAAGLSAIGVGDAPAKTADVGTPDPPAKGAQDE